jgi:hypothetical protein
VGRPEWTNGNVDDPGSPLVELFAFLGEQLLFRADPRAERRRTLVAVGVAVAVGLLWWRRRGAD